MTRIGVPFEVLVKLARTDRTVASVLSMWQNGAIVSLESALILMVETLSSQNQYLMNAYSRQIPVDQSSPDMQTAIERFEAYWRQEQDRQRRAADVATRVKTEEGTEQSRFTMTT